jgi:uncharacterized membrane protein (UPF0127 family)
MKLLLLLLLLALPASALKPQLKDVSAPACVPQKLEKKVPLKFPKGKPITVDVADTPSTRETGLMCVTKMPKDYGMLFVFPNEMGLGFWMKNTLVSLDILWIGADKRVNNIAPRLKASKTDTPDDKVARAGGRGMYVLELAAGEAKRRGLKVGDKLDFDVAPVEK